METKDLIVRTGEEEAEAAILRLQERRERVSNSLAALYEAVKLLIRKKPDYPDLEPFLEQNPYSGEKKLKEIEELAWEVWLRLENSKLKILPHAAFEALGYRPDAIKGVMEAWQAYNEEGTADPKKYWSDAQQKFRPMPVTQKEAEKIKERSTLRAFSPEHSEMLDLVSKQAKLFTFLNKHHHAGYTPGYLSRNCPWWSMVLKAHKVGGDHTGGGYLVEYEPAWSMFAENGEPFAAFDEE